MVNFHMTCELAAQHRQQLLAEAARDRLARQALAGATPTATPANAPARRDAAERRLSILTRVRLALHRLAGAPVGASPT
jgi:hypothetical protein